MLRCNVTVLEIHATFHSDTKTKYSLWSAGNPDLLQRFPLFAVRNVRSYADE